MNIHMIGVRGLFGGKPFGFSLGIDALFSKARALDRKRITSEIFSHVSDGAVRDAMRSAVMSGKRLVIVGHSLGARDAVVAAMAVHAPVSLAFLFDPTWNAPVPPIANNIRRVFNFYGVGASMLGHDRIAGALGYNGYIANIPVRALHQNVDDDMGAHAMFIREIQWLLALNRTVSPEISAAYPERVADEYRHLVAFDKNPKPGDDDPANWPRVDAP